MSVTPYKPIFTESKKQSKKQILESAQRTIKSIRTKIKKLREEEGDDVSDVVDVISDISDSLDDVISDAISELGADSPVITDLIDASSDIGVHEDMADIDDMPVFESRIKKSK